MPPRSRGRAARLIGRAAECRELDSLLEALRRGESRSLVIRGEAGVGKTALQEYLAGRAADGRVIGVTAVQSEVELAFAALHQLCAPILDELEGLPAPQREALRITFGLHGGPVPDRFLVGLAVLSLLAEAAEDRPLVCVVDDAQWLDRASAQVLAFVARRLGMESVGLVFSARVPAEELAGLPQLVIEGLTGPDARALLDTVLTGPVDARGCSPPAGARRRRAAGRTATGVASRGQPGDRESSSEPGCRRRPGGVRRPGALPPPAGALGGLSLGVSARTTGGAPGPGRGDRSGARSGPPRVAPRPSHSRPRRGGRR